MAYTLTQEDEKLLLDVNRAFLGDSNAYNAVYVSPAQALRNAADLIDHKERLTHAFRELLRRMGAATKP